jgi:DNA-binding CsgD family transcriptional regulator
MIRMSDTASRELDWSSTVTPVIDADGLTRSAPQFIVRNEPSPSAGFFGCRREGRDLIEPVTRPVAQRGPAAIPGLTDRESTVAGLLLEGLAAKVIAARLGVSYHTARRHLEHIYLKLGVNCRALAVLRILELQRSTSPLSRPA